ncbi:MAG: hypothetical protein AAF441_11115 [Pseudomonadota bacterium]
MPSKDAFTLKRSAMAAMVGASVLLTAGSAHATTTDGDSGLRQSIGFLSLVKLECEFSPAGESSGTMTLRNPTSKPMNRGIPVIYRLSSTGEQFTTHLKNAAGPRGATVVKHRHADVSRCEAWTYLR